MYNGFLHQYFLIECFLSSPIQEGDRRICLYLCHIMWLKFNFYLLNHQQCHLYNLLLSIRISFCYNFIQYLISNKQREKSNSLISRTLWQKSPSTVGALHVNLFKLHVISCHVILLYWIVSLPDCPMTVWLDYAGLTPLTQYLDYYLEHHMN